MTHLVDFMLQILKKIHESRFLNAELRNINIFKAEMYKLSNAVSLNLYLRSR